MPKDPTRNVDRYKVRGGQFDDLDRTKNDGRLTEDAAPLTGGPEETNFIPGESPQEAAERKQRMEEVPRSRAAPQAESPGQKVRACGSQGRREKSGKNAAKPSAKSPRRVGGAAKRARRMLPGVEEAARAAARRRRRVRSRRGQKPGAGAEGGGAKASIGRPVKR